MNKIILGTLGRHLRADTTSCPTNRQIKRNLFQQLRVIKSVKIIFESFYSIEIDAHCTLHKS